MPKNCNWDEIDIFLERYKLPIFTQKGRGNQNSTIPIREIKLIVKKIKLKRWKLQAKIC